MCSILDDGLSAAPTQHDSFSSLLENENSKDSSDSRNLAALAHLIPGPSPPVRSPLNGAPENHGSDRCSSTELCQHIEDSQAPTSFGSGGESGLAMPGLPSLPLMMDGARHPAPGAGTGAPYLHAPMLPSIHSVMPAMATNPLHQRNLNIHMMTTRPTLVAAGDASGPHQNDADQTGCLVTLRCQVAVMLSDVGRQNLPNDFFDTCLSDAAKGARSIEEETATLRILKNYLTELKKKQIQGAPTPHIPGGDAIAGRPSEPTPQAVVKPAEARLKKRRRDTSPKHMKTVVNISELLMPEGYVQQAPPPCDKPLRQALARPDGNEWHVPDHRFA
jgi:hypothetical protein